MHWQKTGQDNLISAVVRYQLWFGLDLSDRSFSQFVIFVLNLISLAGHDQQQIPRTSPMQNVACKRSATLYNYKLTSTF